MRQLLILVAFGYCLAAQAQPSYYYQPKNYGSESLYNPINLFFSYSFDSLQIRESFSTDNFSDNLAEVFDQLLHPRENIDNEGGFTQFVNRNIFPIDPDESSESYSMLPNYALHLIGGGMVYRRDLEWLRQHGYEDSTLIAVSMAMTAEIIQEALEVSTTKDDDAIADVYIFRPLGIWLFHDDDFARRFHELFDPAIWVSLQGIDVTEDRLVNTGINYVYRPPALRWGNANLFIFSGLATLFGLSHQLDQSHALSWGIGNSIYEVDFEQPRLVKMNPSFGVFYDRNKSLLWSLIHNDNGGDKLRFNYFPDPTGWNGQIGFFISRNYNDSWSAGLSYKFGIGLAGTVD